MHEVNTQTPVHSPVPRSRPPWCAKYMPGMGPKGGQLRQMQPPQIPPPHPATAPQRPAHPGPGTVVLLDMQIRKFGPYLTTIQRMLISAMAGAAGGHRCPQHTRGPVASRPCEGGKAADLDERPLCYHEDAVRVLDRGQPVRHDEHRENVARHHPAPQKRRSTWQSRGFALPGRLPFSGALSAVKATNPCSKTTPPAPALGWSQPGARLAAKGV
jgi:hypothetical protein